jgi:hypothetical protein
MNTVKPTRLGLRLDAPEPGDIVTVKVRQRPQASPAPAYGERPPSFSLFGSGDRDEADNPQHYRMTGLWKVLAVNGGQAVVESLGGYNAGRREMWPIHLHEWFEASELAAALSPPPEPEPVADAADAEQTTPEPSANA